MLLFTHLLGFTLLNPSPLPPPITPTHSHKTLIKGLVITVHLLKAFFFFFFLFRSGSSECKIFFEEIRWSKSTKLCTLPARWRGTTYNLPCVSLCVCTRVCVDFPNFVVDHEGKSILLSRSHQHLAQQKTFPGAFCHGSILIVLAALDCEQTQKEDCSSHSHNYKKIRGIPQIHCMTTTGEASWVRLLCRTKESQTKMSRAFVPPSLREMSQHADLCSNFYRIKWQKNKNDKDSYFKIKERKTPENMLCRSVWTPASERSLRYRLLIHLLLWDLPWFIHSRVPCVRLHPHLSASWIWASEDTFLIDGVFFSGSRFIAKVLQLCSN